MGHLEKKEGIRFSLPLYKEQEKSLNDSCPVNQSWESVSGILDLLESLRISETNEKNRKE